MNKSGRIVAFLILIFGLGITLAACSEDNSPQAVADQFWQALVKGDLDTAKSLATPDSLEGVSIQGGKTPSHVEVGDARFEGDTARVATQMDTGSDNDSVQLTFDTVLRQQDGNWRVDFNETVAAMVSSSLNELGDALQEGMKEMGAAFGDAVDEAMTEAAQGLSEALQEAAEEMKKAADEMRKEREKAEKNR